MKTLLITINPLKILATSLFFTYLIHTIYPMDIYNFVLKFFSLVIFTYIYIYIASFRIAGDVSSEINKQIEIIEKTMEEINEEYVDDKNFFIENLQEKINEFRNTLDYLIEFANSKQNYKKEYMDIIANLRETEAIAKEFIDPPNFRRLSHKLTKLFTILRKYNVA